MAAKTKRKPKTVITVEIESELRLDANRQPVYDAVVTAKRGDLGYADEIEVRHLAEDLARTIEHINSVFFHAEVDGLDAFPNLDDMQPEEQPTPDSTPEDGLTEDPPPDDPPEPSQPSSGLLDDIDYYADMADRYEEERAAVPEAAGYTVAVYGPDNAEEDAPVNPPPTHGHQLSLLG